MYTVISLGQKGFKGNNLMKMFSFLSFFYYYYFDTSFNKVYFRFVEGGDTLNSL